MNSQKICDQNLDNLECNETISAYCTTCNKNICLNCSSLFHENNKCQIFYKQNVMSENNNPKNFNTQNNEIKTENYEKHNKSGNNHEKNIRNQFLHMFNDLYNEQLLKINEECVKKVTMLNKLKININKLKNHFSEEKVNLEEY